LLTIFIAVIAVFMAVRILPGNPVLARFGQHAVPEKVQLELEQQGWNKPLGEQFLVFLNQVIQGDWGESFERPGERVADRLMEAFPATLELAGTALIIAIPCGILLGVLAATCRGRWPDHLAMVLSLVGISIPVFFLGICLIALFPAMPSGFRLPPGTFHELKTDFYLMESVLRCEWDLASKSLRHIVLPAIALSTIPLAVISRVTRSSMLEVLSTDYLRTARVKGATLPRVIWRHAFPNAAIPIANIVGFQIGMLLTGAVLTETVFNWPGLGRYLVAAIQGYDYAVVQAGAILIATLYVGLNLLLDLLFVMLDPKVREGQST
jgi:peptide/nickel transport system permease protein